MLALALAVLVGAAVRWRAASAPRGACEYWSGDWEYYSIGVELSRQGAYREFPGWPATAFRMPLYPSLLGGLFRLFGSQERVRRAQALLDAAAVPGVDALAGALGGEGCGLAAAWAYALSPGLSAELGIETFFGWTVLLVALCLVRWAREPSSARRTGVLGLATGLSLCCRSTLLLLPIGLCAFGGVRRCLLILGCSYGLLAPWALRNRAVFKAFIPFENGAAAVDSFAAAMGAVDTPVSWKLYRLLPEPDREAFLAAHSKPDAERARILFSLALRRVLSSPLSFLGSTLKRISFLWKGQWPWVLLSLGALAAPRWPREAWALILLCAYFNICALMTISPRYLAPLKGVLASLGCWGACEALKKMGLRQEPGAPRFWPAAAGSFLAAVYSLSCFFLWREDARLAPGSEDRGLKAMSDKAVEEAHRGRWGLADDDFSDVLDRDPGFGEALISRALVRREMGRLELADVDCRKALSVLEGR